ncbi:MAG: carboxypeptidase regulatory-like domain-containing protein [Clostridiales bacterium]|nr:carboxypeptidase regulatory-like domain-containing protein [Clostridiales bacterium]
MSKKFTFLLLFALIAIVGISAFASVAAQEMPASVIPNVPNPNAPDNDFDILNLFGADSPHSQMLVTENARSLMDFGAAPAGQRRDAGAGYDRSYVDPHGGEYIRTFVGKEYAGQTYLIDGKPYTVSADGYAVDPIYEKGGYLFTPLYRDETNLYMIAMDFDDLKGDNYAPYGAQRSVLPLNGAIFDLTYPQVLYNQTYYGNDGLERLPEHIFKGRGTLTDGNGVGVVDRLQMMSMGRLKVNAICLNEEYAKLHPEMDELNDKWPWFRAESAMMSYNTQGLAECEDYRQFSRIHQGGIDAAMRTLEKLRTDVLAGKWTDAQIQAGTAYLDKAALAAAVKKTMDDFENVDGIYTVMPPTTHGYGYGWQAGSGIATAFGYNDQSQVLRDSEYRHEFEARTPGGRMLGGGVFGTMNLTRDFSRVITTWLHEFAHTYGLIDDYAYGSMGTNNGETSGGQTNWSIMGPDAAMRTGVDLHAWRKFRLGWLNQDETYMILPGEKKKVAILSVSAQGQPGDYDLKLAESLAALGYAPGEVDNIGARLVAIPKEMRSRDTFGMVWNNGWNPDRTGYSWYDWFINQWAGGETYAIKTFPSFYTVESRKQLGVDQYVALAANGGGVIVSYVANSTWETGHGAGAFKGLTGNTPLRKGGTTTWEDQNIGLSVTVLETGEFFDVVEIEYAAAPQRSAARHVYMGSLTASDSFVQPGDPFAVDFDIFTFANPNTNDGTAAPAAPTRVASPLGVPGGIAGFEMTVEFDPAAFEYRPAGNALPEGWAMSDLNVDITDIGAGKLIVTAAGSRMVDKDTILTLGFAAKAGAAVGESAIKGTITDVALHNWRGQVVKVGGPGFNGTAGGKAVGTYGNGTFAYFHATNTLTLTSEDIKSGGGIVTVGAAPTYNVSGRIVCEIPGPLYGLERQSDGKVNSDNYTGVESVVNLYKADGTLVATTKSVLEGYFSIDGIPDGTYYLTAKKPRYDLGISPEFTIAGADVIIRSNEAGALGTIEIDPLMRERYTMSGVVKGGYSSDGSDAAPLANVDVYIINIGAAYELMGGPVKTDAEGKFTVTGLESFHPYAAIAVSVKGTEYEGKYLPQIHLYPHINKPIFGVTEKLELSLGLNYGESGQDYNYPSGVGQLNAYGGTRRVYNNPGACYNIKLTDNVINRNVTLVETQDVRFRMTTKSNAIRFQLRDMDGNAVGPLQSSLGNTNGDDMVRNVAPGEYYIEVSRPNYISGCTMPFTVYGTRIMLRQSQTANTMDLQALTSGNTISGTVIDGTTGEIIEGASVVCIPFSTGYGKGLPVFTAADGTFSNTVVTGQKDLVFSKEGYANKTVSLASGGATNLKVIMEPVAWEDYKPVLEVASVFVAPGGTVDVTYSIKGNALGFTTLDLAIDYDSTVYKPVTITPSAALAAPGGVFAANPSVSGADLMHIAYASSAKVLGDGLLFTVTYKVENIAAKDVTLDVNVKKAILERFEDEFFDLDLRVKPGALIIGLMGDVDGNGLITPEDAMLLLQMYVGLIPWTPRARLVGDINGDGVIDPVDAALILRMVVGG